MFVVLTPTRPPVIARPNSGLAILVMEAARKFTRFWLVFVVAISLAVAILTLSTTAFYSPEHGRPTVAGALVINLDADSGRWNQTEAQLFASTLLSNSSEGIKRIHGVPGASLDLRRMLQEGKLTREAYTDIVVQDHVVTGVELTLGALGCLESHVAAWRRVIEIGKPLLILEDDVTLSANFDTGLAQVLSQLPSNFGLLYLANIIGAAISPNLLPFNVRVLQENVRCFTESNVTRINSLIGFHPPNRICCGEWMVVTTGRMHT